MELPRMAALSEVQWCLPERKDYAGFEQRMRPLFDLYDLKGYNYAKHMLDIKAAFATDTVKNHLTVAFSTIDNSPTHYTTDGSEPTTASALYKEPLVIEGNCTVKAKAFGKRGATRTFAEEVTYSKSTAKPITLLQPSHRSYTYEGAPTLTDGLKGNHNYRTGRWLGFAGNDFEAIIDLQKPMEISKVSLSTCVEKGDWVFDARGFIIATSTDGEHYTEVFNEQYPAMTEQAPNQIYNHALDFAPTEARYVKVKALVEHSMPEWHGARGYAAFLFVDEIAVD
jgi:hexosaminidase